MPLSGFYRVQAALGLIYVCAGSAKLFGAEVMVEAFDVTGLGQSLRIALGILEIGGGLGLLVPRASIYPAMLLGCTMLGVLGATLGHMAHTEVAQQPLARPDLTATRIWRAGVQENRLTTGYVPTALVRRLRIEG